MNTSPMQLIPGILSLISGIYICAALYHLSFAARKIQTGLHLAFGVMCIMAAGYCFSELAIYRSLSIPSFILALKWLIGFGIAFMVTAVWFTVSFTDSLSRRPACMISIAGFILFAFNLFSPHGILIEKIHRFERMRLPWSEQIAFPDTALGWWTLVLWLFYLSVYLFVLYGCRRLWHDGRRRAALVLAGNVFFFLVAGLIDLAIDLRELRWVYLAEYRYLLCVISMAVYSSGQFRQPSGPIADG